MWQWRPPRSGGRPRCKAVSPWTNRGISHGCGVRAPGRRGRLPGAGFSAAQCAHGRSPRVHGRKAWTRLSRPLGLVSSPCSPALHPDVAPYAPGRPRWPWRICSWPVSSCRSGRRCRETAVAPVLRRRRGPWPTGSRALRTSGRRREERRLDRSASQQRPGEGFRISTQRTCECASNQGVGRQCASCISRVCVDLEAGPSSYQHLFCSSRPTLPASDPGLRPAPGDGRVCAQRKMGYTHQKSKDACKGERHAARQDTVSHG